MQLSRKRIIAAAIGLIEAEGVEAVSLPRLATELGCGVISLYSYVPSRTALLHGVADEVMSGMAEASTPDASWQDQLRAQATAFRAIARARPRCTMVAASLRPVPASVLRPAERALAALTEAGFSGPDAVRIVRAVAAHALGSVLLETGVAPGLTDGDDGRSTLPRLRRSESPLLADLCPAARQGGRESGREDGRQSGTADGFEFWLDVLTRPVSPRPG